MNQEALRTNLNVQWVNPCQPSIHQTMPILSVAHETNHDTSKSVKMQLRVSHDQMQLHVSHDQVGVCMVMLC